MKALNYVLFSAIYLILTCAAPILAEINDRGYRSAPKRISHIPEIVVDWVEPLDECEAEKVCVQGHIRNAGGKPAYNILLRIDIGGTKYIKPTTFLYSRVDQESMEPNDQQEFYVEIDRQVPYKERGKIKTIEVGKYNFKVVPIWTKSPKISTAEKRKRRKSKNAL